VTFHVILVIWDASLAKSLAQNKAFPYLKYITSSLVQQECRLYNDKPHKFHIFNINSYL